MIDGLKVTVSLEFAIRLRNELISAKETLAHIHLLSGHGARSTRSSIDRALQELREAMGEAQHDVRPSGPRRIDTVRGMSAVSEDEE